ncbi:MAG: hypothetical protein WAS33_01315 [Candidatus Promineifilaceae bacterium]
MRRKLVLDKDGFWFMLKISLRYKPAFPSRKSESLKNIDCQASLGVLAMKSMTQIKYVTKNYEALQGLRQLPFGLYFLVLFMAEVFQFEPLQQGRPAPYLILIGVMWVMHWGIDQYYVRTYGQVRQFPKSIEQRISGLWPLLLFAAGLLLDSWLALPISFMAVMLGIWLLVPLKLAWPLLRLHYAVGGLALVGLGLLPLVLERPLQTKFFAPMGVYFLLVFGLVQVFVGLIDHLWLRSVLGSQQEAV